jgi:hypothetical protein
MVFHHRRQMILSILVLLLLVAPEVNAQIAEQDDADRVRNRGDEYDRNHSESNIRGDENVGDTDETNGTTTDEHSITTAAVGNDHAGTGTQVPTIKNAWIHYFDATDGMIIEDMKREGALEDDDIQGTKEYVIV